MDKYKKIYGDSFFKESDGINEWSVPCLKFGDNFASILYAHNINYKDCVDFFKIDPIGRDVLKYKLQDQVDYLNKFKKRIPKKILEIGGGRGEVANFLTYLNYDITSVEFAENAKEWYDNTGIKFFNKIQDIKLINENIKDLNIDLKEYDTIIMCESLEHIPEEHFNNFYTNIKNNFKGYFIVTNWLNYHPLQGNGDMHCRTIDDELYDKFVQDSIKVIYRDRSHLCIEYGKTNMANN